MIIAENLLYQYPSNSEHTLKDISFQINKGEIFGFLGPSGSGKSTTQKILYKLLHGYKGKILVDNKPLSEWGNNFYERIGVSFELPNHYHKLTAYENLRFFSSFYQKSFLLNLDELFKKVDLHDEAHKKVSDYSKGMKMRLNFIRSLLHNPDILFLDEPTSGLDPINGRKIKNIIRELKEQGKTIFITTHNMADADELCDKVAFLHKGEIKALDKPSVLKLKHGKRRVRVTLKGKPNETFYEMDSLGNNEVFLGALKLNHIETIHSEEATLEEVFIKLTGERLI